MSTVPRTIFQDSPARPRRSPGALYLGVFLVSAATLHLETLQTRIFSVMLWHHLTYLVVTFTLLGFAAAGTVLSIAPRLFGENRDRRLAIASLAFSVSTLIAFYTLTFFRLDTAQLLRNRVQYFFVIAYYVYLLVPYFCAGLTIAAALKSEAEHAPRLYAANLVGSAVGCFFFILLLKPLGGAGSLCIVAATAALAAMCFAHSSGAKGLTRAAALLAILSTAGALPFLGGARPAPIDHAIVIEPAPSKAMMLLGLKPERTVWDPLCRLDVTDLTSGDKLIYQDGDAPTALPHGERAIDLASIYGLAYFLKPRPDVLAIGVGGGQDLWMGRLHKAKSVTGAEINPSTAELMRGPYREFSGGIYDLPASGEYGPVHVEVAEGRSFVRRTPAKYDLIQMTGTDTYTALASGAYMMSESYLYTVEAFQDYFDHLNDDGLVAVLRFGFRPPRESLRLCTIAAEAMLARGVQKPSQRVVVVNVKRTVPVDGKPRVVDYAAMLFKKGDFTPAELDIVEQFVKINPTDYSIAYAPGRPSEPEYASYFAAADAGAAEREKFFAAYRYDVRPTYDDSPFFFQHYRWSAVLDSVSSPDWFGQIGEDPVGLYILVTVLIEASLLVLILVLLPLWVFRRRGNSTPSKLAIGLYFFGIGMAYLMLEVAAMQKFALYLGHPVYSLTVVLATFLIFSGLGSYVVDRLTRPAWLAIPGIVILCGAHLPILPKIFAATLGEPTSVRVAISVLLLAPLAFFMGMPFPSAIRAIDRRVPHFVPWAWGVNGGASVLASVVAVLLAMVSGFNTVFIAAAFFYLLALACARRVFGETAGE